MKGRIIFIVLTLILNVSNVFAQKIEIDGIYYYLDYQEETAEVTHYTFPNHYSGVIVIPNLINHYENEYMVTIIGEQAFDECPITSIIIPNTVTYIKQSAFYGCEILNSILIPNGVFYIERRAFGNCEALTSIIIPNGVSNIEEKTFYGCTGLKSIILPSSVKYIGQEVFMLCQKLNAITNLNPVPVDISSSTDIFFEVNITECTLTVPTSAVTVYQNTAVWQDFNIVGGGILVNPTVNNNLWGYTDGNALYSSGETATVTAYARNNCSFVNWTINGELVSTEETYSFTVAEDIELVANFEQHTTTINVAINNDDYGTVTGVGVYPLNSTATLTAVANQDYKFANWIKDGLEITYNPYSFTVTKDEELLLNFREKNNYTVNLTVNNPDYGTVQGDGTYKEDDHVYVLATANTGYYFVCWMQDGLIVSTEKYYGFPVTEDMELQAVFIVNDWGIDDIEKSDIMVYPNPTSGELIVNNEDLTIKRVEVYNLIGKKQNADMNFRQAECILDISHLPAGMYIVRITTEEGFITRKIMKI
ncbi:MAG: leucine-rich repeat protein [Bacteroidales bacterium]|jgi:hypothetical protein|nr:leucine-rich repeat protein [Bacteroidales bacterium]